MAPEIPMSAAIFGGWEIVLIAGILLILLGAKRLPDLARGLTLGIREFDKAFGKVDKEAQDAGESLGGIYGKPAGEALTPDNLTAELYDPAVQYTRNKGKSWWRKMWSRLCGFFGLKKSF